MRRSCANTKNAETPEVYTELPPFDIGFILPVSATEQIPFSGTRQQWKI